MKTFHWIGLALITLLSLILEFTSSQHGSGHHHWWSNIPAFWILFGFIGCLILILVAKTLGKLLLDRKEDYYDID